VRDAHELDGEAADRDTVAGLHLHQPRCRIEARLFELRTDERERERRAVHRPLDERQHVRDGADVILVPVREHERGDFVLLQLPQVRDHEVDAEQLRLREHDAGVDQDRGRAARHDHHVHAELAESPERDQLERRHVSRDGRSVGDHGADAAARAACASIKGGDPDRVVPSKDATRAGELPGGRAVRGGGLGPRSRRIA
jgi:hypothetical protein